MVHTRKYEIEGEFRGNTCTRENSDVYAVYDIDAGEMYESTSRILSTYPAWGWQNIMGRIK